MENRELNIKVDTLNEANDKIIAATYFLLAPVARYRCGKRGVPYGVKLE